MKPKVFSAIDAAFDNPFQNAATDYKSQFIRDQSTKPAVYAPEIHDEFLGDDGEQWYALSNGNTILKEKYDAMWHPKNSRKIHGQNYKGDNPDKTKIV